MIQIQNLACQWKHDDIDGGWDTACGEKFVFTCDGPKEHGFQFCYHCGKPIALAGDRKPAPLETVDVKALASATGSVAWWIVLRPHQKWSRDECGHLPTPIAAFINEGLAKEWIASEAHRNRDIIQPPNTVLGNKSATDK